MLDVPAIVYAVEQVESGGRWWVERGRCVGVMQINPRWSKHTRAELFNPDLNRAEGARILKVWLARAGGNWRRALAGYNCGNAGLRGECGQRYARKVWRLAKQYQETERKLHGWLAWIAKPEA